MATQEKRKRYRTSNKSGPLGFAEREWISIYVEGMYIRGYVGVRKKQCVRCYPSSQKPIYVLFCFVLFYPPADGEK